MVSDESTWPTKLATNSTNIAFMGCNTITIPMNININDSTVSFN